MRLPPRWHDDCLKSPELVLMPVLPKSLLVLGARLQTARTAQRLKRPQTAVPDQWRTWRMLLGQLALTEHGRSIGIERGMDYRNFRSRVTVSGYEHVAPQIERMKRGGANVLWPGQCSLYATSAGTTGPIKAVPVTTEMRQHFRRAEIASMLFYTARVGSSTVFQGRHLTLGASTALRHIASARPFAANETTLGGIRAVALPSWVGRHLSEPSDDIARLTDWAAKLEQIAASCEQLDVTLLGGIPNWMLNLVEAIREHGTRNGRPRDLAAIWPHLECLVHSGVPLGPFQDELRQAFGSNARFHEVYCAAEGFIAAQDAEATAGLRLMANVGLFFEFIALRDFADTGRLAWGEKAVPLEQVRSGIDYVILLTTPAGLCRYILGDIVRFVSTEPHRLMYVGRTDLQLNAFGEHVIEKDLTDVLVTVCNRHRWTIKNFHVAPMFDNSLTGQMRGRHEWWVELRPGTTETPTGPLLAAELDRELLARSPDYQARRSGSSLEAPLVRLVMPGLFKHWMRSKDRWGADHKMPRCRGDRLIADELMAIACFTD